MSEQPITNVEDAVRELGALPMPAGSAPSELERLRARVAELEAERHVTNEALSDAAVRMRADRDRIAELEALTPARHQTCRACGAGYVYGEPCAHCEFLARMEAAAQARVRQPYRAAHDLPELGGQR